MPVLFYTAEEHDAVLRTAKETMMKLALKVCELSEFPCITIEDDSGYRSNDYCDGCPVEAECPHPFKNYSQ